MYRPMYRQIHRPILEHLSTGRVSVECRPMYQPIYRPISSNTLGEGKVTVSHRCNIDEVSAKYRWSLGEPPSISTDRRIGRYIGRYSTDISAYTRSSIDRHSIEYRLIYRPIYRPMHRPRPPIRYMIRKSVVMTVRSRDVTKNENGVAPGGYC